MRVLKRVLFGLHLSLTPLLAAATLPEAGEPVVVTLPDYGAALRSFDDPLATPVAWWPHVVNAAWGDGGGGSERNGGWLDKNWELVDYLDRSADYATHQWLTHRGIWYEVYGSNEYQETIHFHEQGAKELFWDNGIARDMNGDRVLSEHYNTSVPWWKEKIGWDAYIVCNNAPRWSAVIDLGSNREAAVGDVVFAATAIEADQARTTRLHFGASSQAQIWLNGQPLGYVPNEKGVRRNEFECPINLGPGRNVLIVKLPRFWERRWLFYASLDDGE